MRSLRYLTLSFALLLFGGCGEDGLASGSTSSDSRTRCDLCGMVVDTENDLREMNELLARLDPPHCDHGLREVLEQRGRLV